MKGRRRKRSFFKKNSHLFFQKPTLSRFRAPFPLKKRADSTQTKLIAITVTTLPPPYKNANACVNVRRATLQKNKNWGTPISRPRKQKNSPPPPSPPFSFSPFMPHPLPPPDSLLPRGDDFSTPSVYCSTTFSPSFILWSTLFSSPDCTFFNIYHSLVRFFLFYLFPPRFFFSRTQQHRPALLLSPPD